MHEEITSAVLIGAGNVGWHLGLALKAKGVRILQVISRTSRTSGELAGRLGADYDTSLAHLKTEAGIIILAVPDSRLEEVISQCDFRDTLVVHTAGSIPMDIFKGKAIHFGVLYPVMTFTRKKPLEFSSVPLLVEANTIPGREKLETLAGKLSEVVRSVTTEQRMHIHLAAVLACNFTNHMYALAESILTKESIPFGLLTPLIRETAEKVSRISPREAQTGPAVRQDKQTMEKHTVLLSDQSDIAELYRQISKSILTFAKKTRT